MAILRWDPWGEVAALQRDVNELLTRSVGSRTRPMAGPIVPPIDAYSTEQGIVVKMDVPGVDPASIDVSVQEGVLTVSGERTTDVEVHEEAWLRRERSLGAFERTFTLPEGTNPDSISASFDHGVLELRIPQPPEQQPRRIKISAVDNQQAVDVGEG